MKGKFLKKMPVTLLSVVMIAAMFPVCVMAAGDDTETATKISFDKKINGEINETNKVDYYLITLPSSGEVTIKVQTKMKLLDVGLYYDDYGDEKIFSSRIEWDSISETGNKSYTYKLAAGQYYFKAQRSSDYYGTYNGNYNFKVTFESSNETIVEKYTADNNTIDKASKVSLNKKYIGYIAENDSRDYYEFTLSSKSKVNLVFTTYSEGLDLYLYDDEGNKLDYHDVRWNSSTHQFTINNSYELAKGTYYIVVSKRSWCDFGAYDFTINVPKPTPTKKPTATPTPTKKPTPTPTKKPAQTGWVNSGSVWYYYNAKGTKVTGWQKIGGAWYFFNSKGVMQTGWVQDGGKWYFMAGSGAMATGWVYDGGKWYYMSAAGTMVTGWIQLGGTWYYMTPSGAMATGWQQISGKWYYFASSGAMKTGWLQLGKTWYYFDANGAMVTGNYKIDGKTNKFSSSGAWIGYA